ncbi:phosphogluconate dehydratase [Salinisphaera sp. USBA-960]|uniref:phosphogluconate dehydratase n=1 Tax=Salinisphaera orenii TaxID=856731 RepID=UPI000DBE2E6D|nr:phosphogluconate dehydratase [Salifodinibacter halophilus]NNC26796.1 phosphogluconate dehydratase [Salifodinibacter halophilus]
MSMNDTVARVTDRIVARSRDSRADYLARMDAAAKRGPHRGELSCGNLAHGFASSGQAGKDALAGEQRPNIAIVSAYNDMLSAHQPLKDFPDIIKDAAWQAGGVAQFAGGTPAMCDGVTQGQPGMELSLFSRDVIAMAAAVALSHNMFDGAMCLGVCDKIVPGLLIGSLSYGHLPFVFAPAGPMTSGLPNQMKSKVRQRFAAGEIGRDELLKAESMSYHSPGTCTFYGTANSNQLLMEFMGLHIPGTSFVNPGTPLREAATRAAAEQVVGLTALGDNYTPLAHVVDEKAIVNGMVGLLASGGSTNHTMHLVAIARAAGIVIDWDDFAELSAITPLLARVYPNGTADVNHMRAAGGIQLMIRSLLDAGLLHEDVTTVVGDGLSNYTREPFIENDEVVWREGPHASHDSDVVRMPAEPFADTGGITLLEGNLGRGIIKVSAVAHQHRRVTAPARVFASQEHVLDAFKAGELNTDMVVVIPYQGPRGNGMPELHKLTPTLTNLQDAGLHIALLTDGRMSGASGKVPAALQLTPEGSRGGPIAKLRDGDPIVLDAEAGTLGVDVDADTLAARDPITFEDAPETEFGLGRELFAFFRQNAATAEQGAGPVLQGVP